MSKYYGNIREDDTIELTFNTNNSNGASVTVTDLALGDIKIHKDGNDTERSSTSGISLDINFAGVTGNHMIIIDTSDNTDAGFYAVGSNYEVRLEGITVDSQTINAFIGSFSIDNRVADVSQISGDSTAADNLELQFDGTGLSGGTFPSTQDQVSGIANTGAAINTVVAGDNFISGSDPTNYTATGVQVAGTFVSTNSADGSYHQIAPSAGVIDFYYQFNIGVTGVPVSVSHLGRLQQSPPVTPDVVDVYAWDWIAGSWVQIGSMISVNSSIDIADIWILFSNMVGTGSNAGDVRIRFYGTGLDTADTDLYTDLFYCSYAVVASPVGYAEGRIWIDSVNGTSGTVEGVNGTADNPVTSLQEALTLTGLTGIADYKVKQGSTITLTDNFSGPHDVDGLDYTFDLAGYQVDNVVIAGAIIDSNCTGNGGSIIFTDCQFRDCSLPGFFAIHCAMAGTITATEVGVYLFDNCFSAVAGSGSPVFDFGSSIGNLLANFRHHSGGIKLLNMGAGSDGQDKISVEGQGQVIFDTTCVGGEAVIRGNFKVTDGSNGTVSIDTSSNYKDTVINEGFAQGAGTGTNQIQLSANASSVDGIYDPGLLLILEGTGAGQSRYITQYDGTSKIATVHRDWKSGQSPDTTSKYQVIADPGGMHVNEGLAQGGTISTITLNPLASPNDNAYKNQFVFITSGTGADQVRRIKSYVGSTRIATLSEDWSCVPCIPDTTSSYFIIPFACTEVQAIKGQELAAKTGTNLDTFFDNNDTISTTEVGDLDTIAAGVADKTGYSIAGTKQTLDDLNDIPATDIVSEGPITTSSGSVWDVITTQTSIFNSDMRGTNNAATEAKQDLMQTDVTSIEGKIDVIDTNVDNIDTNISIIKNTTDDLGEMIEDTSDGPAFTEDALQNIPSVEIELGEQEIADALKLAPTPTPPYETDSIYDKLDTVQPKETSNINNESQTIVRG